MNSRERILKALNHEEADRLPVFEICVGDKIVEHYLGRKVNSFGNGKTQKVALDIQMKSNKEEYRNFIRENNKDMLEFYHKAGFDMIHIVPAILLTPFDFGLWNFGVAEIYDVQILKESENSYKLISKDPDVQGFWCTCSYSPDSEIMVMTKDNIIEGGEKEFKRYVEYLESRNLDVIPEQLKFGLDAQGEAVDLNNEKYNLFILGYADIQFPAFTPYLPLFLELMITNGSLIHRFMRITTDSMKAMLKIELDMGIDGVIGGCDWAYRSGTMISPKHFKEFMAPYLKELVDLTHDYGKYYVKHLDGNINSILDLLVNYCGIDAYHAIESRAGMDIVEVKKKYGDKITVVGNMDCGELVNWSPNKVKEEAKRIIKSVSSGGGHIFSSDNAIHGGISVENFIAYMDAVKEYGIYPINI